MARFVVYFLTDIVDFILPVLRMDMKRLNSMDF